MVFVSLLVVPVVVVVFLFGWLVGIWFGLVWFGSLRQGFSVALEPVLELALIDQDGLELTEIYLPLPSKC